MIKYKYIKLTIKFMYGRKTKFEKLIYQNYHHLHCYMSYETFDKTIND